ncbi:MAG: molecular chaperone GroEL [Bacilli bacterium]|nr:molecular chaperone GroEL [Bacilli bacterium]
MTGKVIISGDESRERVIEGVNKICNAIKVTLGPSGRGVSISGDWGGPEITRDGASVAKSIQFKDPGVNQGAMLVRKAATLTEEQAGDGTSTCSILTQELCRKGLRALNTGANVNEIKSGMLKAQKWVTEYIKSKAIKVDGDLEQIRKVATISANNDPEVGDLVVDCMGKVGINGVLTADMASGLETVIDVTTGMKIERGWSSPQYVTSPEDSKCVMDDPYVLVVGEKISSVAQILPLMQLIVPTGRPFLFVCDDIDEVVNTTLVMNTLQGAIRCCVIKGIDFGDSRKNIMNDIAVACGATFVCPENGMDITEATLKDLGAAKKVVVSRDSTIIYEGAGDPKLIQERAEVLKKRLADPGTSAYDKSKFEKRLAGLAGGIGVIKAGGATEAEKQNRKATIEDAILAAKSAIEEGCAPGGGYVYYQASLAGKRDKSFWKFLSGDETEGAKIVFDSLPIVMWTVAENSGAAGDVVLSEVAKSKKDNWGYDAKAKAYCNLSDSGILDSAKVLRVALENSVSTASMILLIDCIIYEEATETKE